MASTDARPQDPDERAAARIREEVAQLRAQNESLRAELRRQNEYDLSQGRAPGKFREHFTLSCIEANQKSIEQLEQSLARLGGADRSLSDNAVINLLLAPISAMFPGWNGSDGRKAQSLPPSLSAMLSGDPDERGVGRGGRRPRKYSARTVQRIEKLEIEIENIKSQNVYLLNELRTYEAYDMSQGRTPGRFREHMTLSIVESNKKSIEQMEAVLDRLRNSHVSRSPPKIVTNLGSFRGVSWECCRRHFTNRSERFKSNRDYYFLRVFPWASDALL